MDLTKIQSLILLYIKLKKQKKCFFALASKLTISHFVMVRITNKKGKYEKYNGYSFNAMVRQILLRHGTLCCTMIDTCNGDTWPWDTKHWNTPYGIVNPLGSSVHETLWALFGPSQKRFGNDASIASTVHGKWVASVRKMLVVTIDSL